MKPIFASVVLCLVSQALSSAFALDSSGPELNATSDALNSYCHVLQEKVRRQWRFFPGFDRPVTVDIDVDDSGKVVAFRSSPNDTGSEEGRLAALMCLSRLSQVDPAPPRSVKLELVLCNDLTKVKVRNREDWEEYLADLERRIRRAWTPTRSKKDKCVVTQFQVFSDGRIEDVCVLRSSGDKSFDRGAVYAVKHSSPATRFPDDACSSILVEFCLENEEELARCKLVVRERKLI